jgi:hypothetical protein
MPAMVALKDNALMKVFAESTTQEGRAGAQGGDRCLLTQAAAPDLRGAQVTQRVCVLSFWAIGLTFKTVSDPNGSAVN